MVTFKQILAGALVPVRSESFTDILVPAEYGGNFLVHEIVNIMTQVQYDEAVQVWLDLGQSVPEGHIMVILIDNVNPSEDFSGRVKVKYVPIGME
jgi:hypothetical protein